MVVSLLTFDVAEARYKAHERTADYNVDLAKKRVLGELDPFYPESFAQSHTKAEYPNLLVPPCRTWGQVGVCEAEGHEVVHELICNREWCVSECCGGNDGAAHQRRKAKWYPRARQIKSMGRFVSTIPPEIRHKYRTKRALGQLGIAFKRLMQRHGYDRGLRRWHFFGEDHYNSASGGLVPKYHPHLEMIVEGGYLAPARLQAIKQGVANILKVSIDRVNLYYQYTREIGKMCHFISYALRPTFLHWEWDEELAHEFIGFKNALPWGKWKDELVWEIPADPEGEVPSGPLIAIEAGYCPRDGSRLVWSSDIRQLSNIIKPVANWVFLDGGYWLWGGPP